ncbi:MAG: right-handed parallel beta-helix repeat-containing protein [Planctomycetota bacterium]
MISRSVVALGVAAAMAGPAAGQNLPVRFAGLTNVFCDGDRNNEPPPNCGTPPGTLQSRVEVMLRMDTACFGTIGSFQRYEGVTVRSSEGNELFISGNGTTGTGEVGFHHNEGGGSMRITDVSEPLVTDLDGDAGGAGLGGSATDIVMSVVIDAFTMADVEDVTGEILNYCPPPEMGTPTLNRSYGGSATTTAVLDVLQPVILTARGGDVVGLSQFSIGDTIPVGQYAVVVDVTFGGGLLVAEQIIETETVTLELTMPDCNGNGISDLSEAGVPCPIARNVNLGVEYGTLAGALAAARSGDTIDVFDAIICESDLVVSVPLTLRGVSAAQSVIDAENNGRGLIIDIGAGDVLIENLTFRNGATPLAEGGGNVYSTSQGTVRFLNCNFENGVALRGGGVAMSGIQGVLDFADCNFFDNRSSDLGGAVFVLDQDATFRRCVFERSSADVDGGAAFLTGGLARVAFEDCLFRENSAGNLGGDIASQAGLGLTIERSSFTAASAPFGGSLAQFNTTDTVVRSSVFDFIDPNSTGSVIYAIGTNTARFENVTAVNNAGAFGFAAVSGAEVRVYNGIMWANGQFTGGVNQGIYESFNSITPEGGGTDVAIDPLFRDQQNGDYRLQPGSPAIDRSLNEDLTGFGAPFDAGREPRFHDDTGMPDLGVRYFTSGTEDYFPVADLGAFEFQGTTVCPVCRSDYNGDGVHDIFDLLEFLDDLETPLP